MRPDIGRIRNNFYENDSLGFRYEFPQGWRVRNLGDGTSVPDNETGRDVYLLIRLQNTTFPMPVGQIDVRAVDVSDSPLTKKERILPDESPRERNRRLKRKRGPVTLALAGRSFTRTDFKMRSHGVTILYETKFTTVVGNYVLVFTLMAGDETVFQQVLKTMERLTFRENKAP